MKTTYIQTGVEEACRQFSLVVKLDAMYLASSSQLYTCLYIMHIPVHVCVCVYVWGVWGVYILNEYCDKKTVNLIIQYYVA